MSRTPRKPKPPAPPEYPKIVEVFGVPYLGGINGSAHAEASCFNGVVSVDRYRVTVEKIEEPIEVIRERLIKLYEESDNWHHHDPLRVAGLKVGIDLLDDHKFGSKAPRR